jgi:hypothetical protein
MDCVQEIYTNFFQESKDVCDAVRRVCRKLDLYWNEAALRAVERTSNARSIMAAYISKINGVKYIGKSFDDTIAEGLDASLYDVSEKGNDKNANEEPSRLTSEFVPEPPTDEVRLFWGPGYTPAMYYELEERRKYWMSKYPDGAMLDVGAEAIIRQVCNLEIDINHDRASGKAIDKSVNALNTLLGSLNMKPAQQKSEDSTMGTDRKPFGVLINIRENTRPIPEPDPEFKDVDGIVRYITVWFLGHLCKMLGIKNTYCKLYEEEMARRRVERPEYDEEDDESMFNDIFSHGDSEDEASVPQLVKSGDEFDDT